MKRLSKNAVKSFLLLLSIFFIVPNASALDEYRFERMWPTLQQPWYFHNPYDISIDNEGHVYIVDSWNFCIHKLTTEGQFITSNMGGEGIGDGQFSTPQGIATDNNGNYYVADTLNHRIQKFTPNGRFISKWGTQGTENGQFDGPFGIAIDDEGNVYVADTFNNRIQKFTQDGQFISKWGEQGTGNGEFDSPYAVEVDSLGNVFVADSFNDRIQKFTQEGRFVTKWGERGTGDGQFNGPGSLEINNKGDIYVGDRGNHRIQKFSSKGAFITVWGEQGEAEGQFYHPMGISTDSLGNVYVVDSFNNRIQKFNPNGEFISKWGAFGNRTGEFGAPWDLAKDENGNIYVTDMWNHRIQKFTSDGQFMTEWGSLGSCQGQFHCPHGIAVSHLGNVYVADTLNHRIQKFTTQGEFLSEMGGFGSGPEEFKEPDGIAIDETGNLYVVDSGNHRVKKYTTDGRLYIWGEEGDAPDKFHNPSGIALDGTGNVYVTDWDNHRIKKYSAEGNLINYWGSEGSGDGQFRNPAGVTINASDGNVYVADYNNDRFQVFTPEGQFVAKWGKTGYNPGQIYRPTSILFNDTSDRFFISDSLNHRIQIFRKDEVLSDKKAIIVAGGGPFPGNTLWDATEMCSNYAYRTISCQGYSKDAIYYLTSDTDLDLDGNGALDDVDGDVTNNNLKHAITTWASDATDLLIYMTGHGGDGTFRMGETELLCTDLDSWLDELQTTLPGKVMLIYDGCQSGSFLPFLTPPTGKERILITSASEGEYAYFTAMGSLSFSYIFWGHIFNGMNVDDSFVLAKNAVTYTYSHQTPQLDDNGNGIGNEDADGALSQATIIGNGVISSGDVPIIGEVSPDQTLNGEQSAVIYAENVLDDDGISRVWAVITPTNFDSEDPNNPILNLPVLEMSLAGNNRFEGTYSNFNMIGTYSLAIYARDSYGNLSSPMQTNVHQKLVNLPNSPLPPALNILITGMNVTASWNEVSNADSYTLSYAVYPYVEGASIYNLEMGSATTLSVDLWSRAAFYIAVQAKNSGGISNYSNVAVVIIP